MEPINRRTLLTSGAAVAAASTFSLAKAQSDPPKVAGAFTVRAGAGRPAGQWIVHGEKAFSMKVSGADVGNQYAMIEIHTPPGLGPELHIHSAQNELFYVLRGSIGVQCGSQRTILRAGDSFMAPADLPHAFVTLGKEPAHTLFVFDPAGDMEGFFAEYAAIVGVEGELDRGRLAEAYARHGLKIVGPPLMASSFAS